MKKMIIVAGIILLIGIIYIFNNITIKSGLDVNQRVENKMQIKSVFKQGERIPVKYTADGDDVNPPLEISRVPSGTESLVLIVDDPDAPAGDWVHWIVFNIPAGINKIDEGASLGIAGVNSWGRNDYGGPSPPSGIHRYFFKVYALDIDLNLDSSAEKEDILNAIEGHVLDKGELMGVYERR